MERRAFRRGRRRRVLPAKESVGSRKKCGTCRMEESSSAPGQAASPQTSPQIVPCVYVLVWCFEGLILWLLQKGSRKDLNALRFLEIRRVLHFKTKKPTSSHTPPFRNLTTSSFKSKLIVCPSQVLGVLNLTKGPLDRGATFHETRNVRGLVMAAAV